MGCQEKKVIHNSKSKYKNISIQGPEGELGLQGDQGPPGSPFKFV